MSKYIIPEADRVKVHENENRPKRHEFGYSDGTKFYFDENTKQYLDFDYDSIFQAEFSKTLDDYLSGLGKKAKIKASRYISDYAFDIKEVDFKLFGLKKEKIIVDGELSQNKFWAEYDEPTKTYSDLVIEEDIVYNRDSNDYTKNRVKTIKRFDEDDNVAETKEITKHYSNIEATKAGEKKRAYQIADMKINTIGLIAQTEQITIPEAEVLGIDMILEMDREINMYIMGAKQPLIDAINVDSNCLRLDNDIGGITIRQYLVNELQK